MNKSCAVRTVRYATELSGYREKEKKQEQKAYWGSISSVSEIMILCSVEYRKLFLLPEGGGAFFRQEQEGNSLK